MFEMERQRLIDQAVIPSGVTDKLVLAAMNKVPRHKFVPKEWQRFSYTDNALSLGHGQTISAPSIVGIMTQALDLKGGEKVLEVGTGSGYQTAILAEIAGEVISIERIEDLANEARVRLNDLGYTNVKIIIGDGTNGYKHESPYDAILVTAGAKDTIPQPLVDQLKEGGRIVIPVGEDQRVQVLKVGIKKKRLTPLSPSEVDITDIIPVAFVPLIGEYSWKSENR